jgi:hypothetical protein
VRTDAAGTPRDAESSALARLPGRRSNARVLRPGRRRRPLDAGARHPENRIIDTNGAADIFHGAASAHAIQHLGNEDSLPTLGGINTAHTAFDNKREPPRPIAVE